MFLSEMFWQIAYYCDKIINYFSFTQLINALTEQRLFKAFKSVCRMPDEERSQEAINYNAEGCHRRAPNPPRRWMWWHTPWALQRRWRNVRWPNRTATGQHMENKTNPGKWRVSILLSFHKKCDSQVCANYRGISLLCIAFKALETILLAWLTEAYEPHTRDNQAEFKKRKAVAIEPSLSDRSRSNEMSTSYQRLW